MGPTMIKPTRSALRLGPTADAQRRNGATAQRRSLPTGSTSTTEPHDANDTLPTGSASTEVGPERQAATAQVCCVASASLASLQPQAALSATTELRRPVSLRRDRFDDDLRCPRAPEKPLEPVRRPPRVWRGQDGALTTVRGAPDDSRDGAQGADDPLESARLATYPTPIVVPRCRRCKSDGSVARHPRDTPLGGSVVSRTALSQDIRETRLLVKVL